PGQIIESTVPAWNARRCPPGRYRIVASCFVQGGDVDNSNDTTYSFYNLRYGPVFAYDPPTARNDVPDFTQQATGSRVDGRGLNTEAYSAGVWPNSGSIDGRLAFGPEAGSASGQFAMRFQLLTQDTIKGFQAWMGEVNQSPDPISFALYRGGDAPQAQPIAGTKIGKQRGFDDVRKDLFYGQYTTYLFDKPVVLAPGEYWASVAQLGLDGLALGASKARVGQMVTHHNINPPGPGVSGTHLNIDKSFRQLNAANQLINKNVFAYERTAYSGTWVQATPLSNPMFGHLSHADLGSIQGYRTASRGTWLPLIRPFLGDKSYATEPTPDDNCIVPVELSYFDGHKRNNSVDLFWQTASEENNAGFHVERRIARGDTPTNWESIQFVRGAGNSTVVRDYSITDEKVQPGVTYQYRLAQMDLTGTESCKAISDVLEFTIDETSAIVLEQNVPNPFSMSTSISFYVRDNGVTKLEIVDMFGRTIRTLFDGNASSGKTTVEWDGTDDSGANVATGTYIYRLTNGNNTEVAKMTITR
ncbi:MAG: FlgD immunoglobulin-like domain containing protein, partial [Ignavibacteria bacterium]